MLVSHDLGSTHIRPRSDPAPGEKYFAATDVIHLLIGAGGKYDKHSIANAAPQYVPRLSDAELVDAFELTGFTAGKQPFYERWVVLYELMGD
jgi:hypothetical protein